MRRIVVLISVLSLAGGLGAATQTPDAAAILGAARAALGGEDSLAAIKAFVATGRTRQVRGNNLVPIEFEIACELPDKYVRRDEIPAQETGITASGFSGETLIQVPPPPPQPVQPARPPSSAGGAGVPPAAGAAPPPAAGRGAPPVPAGSGGPPARAAGPGSAGAPPADPRRMRVISLKQDFVKLTLGMFAASFPSYPVTFTVAGKAEAPQGTADVLDVKAPDNFGLRLFIHAETHLPIMVSWTVPATNVVVSLPGAPPPENLAPGTVVVQAPPPPGPAATPEEQSAYAKAVQDLRKKALAEARPIEHRVYYADYRDVGKGVKFPFRLRRSVAGETVEETNFDGFKLNPRIDPRKFQMVGDARP